MTPEGRVLSSITNFLRTEQKAGKCYYERRQAVGYAYRKGVPDIWFCKDGKHYEVEIKKPGGERTALQIQYEHIFKKLNVKYACIDSYEKFIEFYNAE